MSSAVDRMIQALQTTTLFQDLEHPEVEYLLEHAKTVRVEPNGSIFEENEFGDSLMYIIDGEVFLTRQIGEEEEFLGMLGKGDTFGETGLLSGGIRTATVRAKRQSLLLEFDKTVFDALPDEVAIKMMRNIAVTTTEKLQIANYLINRLYEQIRELRPDEPDWEQSEEEFIQGFEDMPET